MKQLYKNYKKTPLIIILNAKKKSFNDLIEKIKDNFSSKEEIKTFNECFQDLKKEWYPKLEENTKQQYDYIYRKFEPIYNKNISELKIKDLQEFINPYLYNKGIKQKIKVILNKTFEYAEKYDYIDKDYSKFIDIGKIIEANPRNIYTEKEIKKLWSLIENDCVKIVLIMIYTGMRIGEIRTLKKENIFLKNKVPYCIGGSKTNAGRNRIIPLSNKILPIIKYFFNNTTSDTLIDTKYDANQFNIWLRRQMKKLGFNHKSHDARHTFATKMRLLNTPIDITKKIMGHKCNSLLLDTYTHLDKKSLIYYVNKL